jgi:uncharacterized protein YjbI with pentapeptide repeats
VLMISTLAVRIRQSWHIVALTAVVSVAALAILAAFFLPITNYIAGHDVGALTGPNRAYQLELARDAARGRLIQVGSGLFFAAALVYTARSFTLSRRTFELTEQGQVTQRYTDAIKQLGSGKLSVRIGGIFALERIAYDSARDHPAITEVLAAFIREQSLDQRPGELDPEQDHEAVEYTPRQDVQSAITVLGRRLVAHDIARVNLAGANLQNVDIAGANLAGANLVGANLAGANLARANLDASELTNANLSKADLTKAILNTADLCGANLTDAFLADAQLARAVARTTNFSDAKMTGTILANASLIGANFTGADLTETDASSANFARAKLNRANLTRANLFEADLTNADLPNANLAEAELAGADLMGALLPQDVTVPDGWTRPPGSVRLAPISETPLDSTSM